uniref:clavaminate synthase-like protein At3g21360 n=1 Tax=Erigeron canadensis TaxID=72917 RepID=UPI001CB8EBB8|nr:clavaminate synthase-like protein At3g21360 [Erigeron canadensis]
MAIGGFFKEVVLPEQKSYGDSVLFPAVLSPTINTSFTVFEEAIKAEMPWLDSLLKERGAILFRDFPVTSPSDFNDVVEAFGYPEAPYIGGRASRTQVIGRVYTANETPPDKRIPFHHEMAYVPDYPSKICFYCEEAPGSGGQTPIVLSHIVYDKMKERHPEFVARLEEHGVTYIILTGDEDQPSSSTGRGWKSAYNTDDKKVAEERAAKLGTRLEWMGNAAKVIAGPMPAIRFDKESQRKTWFNNLTGPVHGSRKIHDKGAFAELGNGEAVDDDIMEDCMRILDEECAIIPWKKGDVMLVNNLTVLHAREPLLKPPRRVLAAICK